MLGAWFWRFLICFSVGWSTTLIQTEISQQTTGRIAMEHRTLTLVPPDFSSSANSRLIFLACVYTRHSCSALRMSCNNLGDPPTLHVQ